MAAARRAFRSRCTRHSRPRAFENFHLHLGSRWNELRQQGQGIGVDTSDGRFAFDHLVQAMSAADH